MALEKISHFEIRDSIGAGGMGVVFKAFDTKLKRCVAIKALARHIAHNSDYRKRFLIEAQAAAALNHPNIATIFETLEEENEAYIVMEFIEGEELSKKISKRKLEVTEALDYAIQIAEGLKEAHSKGIVHRDIKSANIMVTGSNLVKIMDFGLAKLAGQSMITQMGTTMGTINYMSPEQTRGEEIDQRTDLWALGVILYEMLTGKLPFKGDYEQAIIYSILNEDPKPVSQIQKEIPVEIDEVMKNLLAKLPDNRYQNADELLIDLKAIKQSLETGIPVELIKSKLSVADYISQSKTQIETAAPKKKRHIPLITSVSAIVLLALLFLFKGAEILRVFGIELIPSIKHIAVLPFEVIGGKADDQAFATGLLATVTSKLSQLEQFEGKLWVVPSSEIRRAKITDITEAVNKFGVNLALAGSIQKMEKGYRVTINLIDGESKQQLASRMMDDQFTSSSTIQDEAIIQVADMLNIELKPEVQEIITAGNTKSPEAYEQFIIGKGLLAEAQKMEELYNAKKFIETALSIDSTFYPALVVLAETQVNLFLTTKEKEWIDKSLLNCNKALEFNKNYLEGLILLGNINLTTGEFQKTIQISQRVLELDPSNLEAYRTKAKALTSLGLMTDAELVYKKIIQIKPDYGDAYNSLGTFYFRNGKYIEALDQFKKTVELLPNYALGYRNLGTTYYYLNELENTIAMYKKSISIEPDHTTYSNLATIFYKRGKYAEAARMYEKVTEMRGTDYRVWGNLAGAYYWAPGEKEKSKDACRKSISLAELQLKINPKDTDVLTNVASYYGMLGQKEKVAEILRRLEKMEIPNIQRYFSITILYEQWMNDRIKALKWMKKALEKGYPLQDVYKSPVLKSFVEDERFKELARKYSISS